MIIKDSKIKNINIEAAKPIVLNIFDCKITEHFGITSPIEQLTISNKYSDWFSKEKNNVINYLYVKFIDQREKGNILVRDSKIRTIKLEGEHNGTTLFKNITCSGMAIFGLINTGNFRFHNTYFTDYVTMSDVSMGKTDFTNVNFNEEIVFAIVGSNMSDIYLNNTDFPSNINAGGNYTGAREVYRQLKYVSSKQGNRIQELIYESLEIDAFKKDKSIRKSWGDDFILWTNKWSNNHGQDWRYSFFGLILLSIIFYNVLKLQMKYVIEFGFPSANEISEYINFSLNPLHDFDKVFKESIVKNVDLGKARLVDSVYRIFSGYYIFQFLRAFRKYVK